ncbi:lysine-specific demethylase 5B [Spea bombifrons]|uniref:lysine-specific demethylase 5B n=1 Tax=Spea bombifrons TaxID=233779 RepID=UPI00234ABE61|nr:lysine-specific demethylase 5B [Spea bombifrons]XP_053310213.1 lysine-specific demethylase 5B [Spea bombifrons]
MEFVPPPECPVFEPTREEFADPYAFINKIRPIAEQSGICKVRPPQDWQPPFACDVDKLHFTPRIQRLNELEAQTRVKLNFLDQIAKFWELQGCTLKIPHVERKILDLFQLNKLVAEEGGLEVVCRERKWTKIATRMGFAPGKAVGSHIRGHFERILYPYNLFQASASLTAPDSCTNISVFLDNAELEKKQILSGPDVKEKEYKPHDIPQRQSIQPSESCTVARRANRMRPETVKIKTEDGETIQSRTLRRRMESTPPRHENGKQIKFMIKHDQVETVIGKPKGYSKKCRSLVDLYVCLLCGSGSNEDRLLLCDGCDDSYHTFCLVPPLHDVPKGDWRCPKCLAQECSKPQEAFGFEQASRDYTLRMFGEMADNFKSDYFNMPVHMVPTELVEKEFWRLVSTIEEDVTVEYGADIASKEFGSGFPVRDGKLHVKPEEEEYLDCGWNLNNMPVMEPSVLTHITADICGMKLPWLYVGMCFSSFCWHIEDHWSYSINYLHWGEPKTWYGAPGYAAEQLEEVMKKLAPELFIAQPDLLHQLVTIMNPNTLMAHGVPIYRTNQCAGEFVITFPRAYHSGFNQGFNFAEAVNFCTVDWLPLGRQCVEHYRMLNRYCVFSHDEMICKMASKAEQLNVVLASFVQKDLSVMINEERTLREAVRKLGVVQSEKIDMELLADDERQCAKCKTTCFISAVYCPCSPGTLVCLHHVKDLCSCATYKYKLCYRYTLDDLYPMMNAVKLRAESYDKWSSKVIDILKTSSHKKDLSCLQLLVAQSEEEHFPENDLLRHLRVIVKDAEKCEALAQQLLDVRRHTCSRFRSGGGKSPQQLTVAEFRSFVRRLNSLPCVINQASQLKDLLHHVQEFQMRGQILLTEDKPQVSELQRLLDYSFQFDLDLPLGKLWERLAQARWLEEQEHACQHPEKLTLEIIRRLIDLGFGLTPHSSVEKAIAKLQEILTICEHWEEKCRSLLKARSRQTLGNLSIVLREVDNIPACVPSVESLRNILLRAQEWLQKVESLQNGTKVPVMNTLVDLVTQGQTIPVHLEPLSKLEALVDEVHTWKESATSAFLMPSYPYSLLEVLCPRTDFRSLCLKRINRKIKAMLAVGGKNKYFKPDGLKELEQALSESSDTCSAMAILSEARLHEMESLNALRISNESICCKQQNDWKICVCQGMPFAPVIQCELCRARFHPKCVKAPQPGPKVWLCPHCLRSKKPPLEKILPLMASLQRLRVRLPEGDALRYLIERTVNWQHRAQQMLSSGIWKQVQKKISLSRLHTPWQATAKPLEEASNVSQCIGVTSISLPHESHHGTIYFQSSFAPGHSCIALNNFSAELNELLMEAQLLQVSLPEIQELYQAIVVPEFICSTSGVGCEEGNINQQETDRTSVSSGALSCIQKDRSYRRLKRCHEGTEVRMKKISCYRKRGMISLPSIDLCCHEQLPDEIRISDFAHESDDDSAVCPADCCIEPEGDEVDWVQCDGSCNRWFHQVCVGLSAETAEKEDYMCTRCNEERAAA